MTALHFCARFRHIAAGAALVTAATAPRAEAQQETLAAVLDRAGRYVVEFHRQLSGIVAEEHYLQEVKRSPRSGISRFTSSPTHQLTNFTIALIVLPD